MIKKIDSNDSIICRDLGENDISITYSPNFQAITRGMIKLSKAVLKLDFTTKPKKPCQVFFTDNQTSKEYIIDEFNADSNKVCIDITDELQDCLTLNQNFVLRISGVQSSDINLETKEVILEYYFKKQSIQEQATYALNAGKAGSGEINLATGLLKFSFQDVISNSKVLPIKVMHTYNSLDAGLSQHVVPYLDDHIVLPACKCGNGWKTNFNQFIVKEVPSNGTHSDNETSARFTYINADGDFILFDDKYYYKDSEGQKNYLEASKVSISQDGKLTYLDELGESHTAFKEIVSDSGLSLVTKYENLQGVSLLEQDNENIASLKQEIKIINSSIQEMTLQKQNNIQAIELLNLSNSLSLKNQQAQEYSLENEEDELDYQKEVRTLNIEYRNAYEEYNKLVTERTYKFKDTPDDENAKVAYPTEEEYTQKTTMDKKSKAIEDKNLEKTWGNNSNEINGLMKRKENILTIQKDIFEMNKQYSAKQLELEIKKLNEQNQTLSQSLNEYEELLLKKSHQLETLQAQTPEILLIDSSGSILGFNATKEPNVYKLFVLMDNYDNQIQLSFENNSLDTLIDSDKNELKFEYENGLLCAVEDTKNRKSHYIYDSHGNLSEVHYPSGSICKYKSDEQNRLLEIINLDGMGYRLEYTGQKVSKVEQISYASKISNDRIEASKSEPTIISSITIQYNSTDSTSILNNKTRKTTTYVFDNLGRTTCTYNNVFENGSIVGNVNAVSYERNSNISAFTIKESGYSQNFLPVPKNEMLTLSENYLGDGFECGDDIVAISLADSTKVAPLNRLNPIFKQSVSAQFIQAIKTSCTTDLVFSAWAKADSAWVARKNTDYCGKCSENSADTIEQTLLDCMDSLKNSRRFELRALLTYSSNGIEQQVEQYCSFDWMNTDWQYCAFPITIDENLLPNLEKIEVFFDYSNNVGDALLYGLSLKKGDWEYSEFKDNLKTYSESSSTDYITTFEYDTNKRLIKSTMQKKNQDATFVSTYAYNHSGALVRSVDFTGMVTENLYNDKGSKIKSVTYHKDQPTSKFVSAEVLDDKGQSTVQLNEFGEKIAEKTFLDKTGLVETTTDSTGNKICYGYDINDDTLLELTATVNDETNTNTMHYTADLLTSLTHNNTEIKFEYDGFGNQSKVEIAGKEYYTTTYEDIVQAQTLEDGTKVDAVVGKKITTKANNETFISYINLDGNPYKVETIDATGQVKILVQNEYDLCGNLSVVKDSQANNETKYQYDELGRLTQQTQSQNGVPVSINYTYDKFGNVLTTTIQVDKNISTYQNTFDYSTPNTTHVSTQIGDITETYSHDKLGRINSTKLGSIYSKHFSYLQKGDHTSNLISSEWFGKNNQILDSIKYGYDQNGNITKVFENGTLVAQYEYDSLSRLTREDNKKLGTTTTFQYDCGGNISRKTIHSYTTITTDSLVGGVVVPYSYPLSGWKDQLLSYNGEKFEYDMLGNPTTYRGKKLTWKLGRQLATFDNVSYNYNASGIRTSKTFNNITTNFYLDGSKILAQDNGNFISFIYGNEGVIGFTYQGVGDFYYKKNILGDIIAIFDKNGQEIAKYAYDAWGNHKTFALDGEQFVDISLDTSYSQNELNNKFIAQLNPFRYRGYYYDTETGLYYLNSRYYDPELGRFINADNISVLNEGKDFFNGLNLYAYCGNNPIMNTDENGNKWWEWLVGAFIVIASAIAVLITAGGAFAGMAAVTTVLAGGTTATLGSTIFAGIFIGSFTTFSALSIVAGISSIGTLINGGSFADALNTFNSYGKSAMLSTISSALIGGISGTLAWKEQHPKITHSWTTEAKNYWRSQGFDKAPIGSDGYSMQLHHPYGRSGAGFYSYYPITKTDHINLHKAIGYKNFAIPYPYTNYWQIFKPLLYLIGAINE